MGQNNHVAEEIWLESYFEYCDHIEISIEAELTMLQIGVTLPEILHVFRTPEVTWSERNRDGCIITVKGRNCDDEEITVFGGFNSETQLVSVFNVEKT